MNFHRSGMKRKKPITRYPRRTGRKSLRDSIPRLLWVAVGSVCVGIGVVGVVVPLLPTTPFLLLAAFCYSRGSPVLRRWLLSNRVCGEYLRSYIEGRGFPYRVKAFTLALLWGSILITSVRVTGSLWVRVLLLGVAAGVSIHILSLPGIQVRNKEIINNEMHEYHEGNGEETVPIEVRSAPPRG